MSKHVDADALLAALYDADAITPRGAKMIREFPAVEAVEEKHGRWIRDDETGEPICSICHSGKPTKAICSSVIEHKLNDHEIRYCYYCGAKMDMITECNQVKDGDGDA